MRRLRHACREGDERRCRRRGRCGEFAEKQLYCPFCNSKIIKGQYGYFCSSRKETGCNFSVNFEICGKKISNGPIFKLIEQGKTSLIKGFKNKDGSKEFDAYLVVDKNQI